ncbi:MAG TPA: c-type cytochrome biogenesis protein CcsB [Actinomycetota bacterium]|jgi:cytochrome c-type biogenesis protein CcsB
MTHAELAVWSKDLFNVALFAYLAAMVASFAYLAFRAKPLAWASTGLGVAGLLANVASIVTRGMAAGRTPWGNMYEYSAILAALVVVAYLVAVEWRAHLRTLGGFVYAFVVFTMAMAVQFFYVGPTDLLPALNSYWRQIHVTSMIAASSLLGIGCVFTILYLVKDRGERRRVAAMQAQEPPPILGAAVDADTPPDLLPEAGEPDPQPAPGGRRGPLPSAATLDRLAYRFIAFGFPIWTFGTICGAIWAQEAWGRYWGWDPKETWAFITWVIFAGYLHARATVGWKGRRAAVIALVGFVSLFVTYYAVNLWISGLHSYA